MDQLRALRYLVAVAEDLSFSRAADRLGVAQPTLSRSVREFEDAHGVVLFERTTRSVALTDAGHALVREAILAIEQADRAVLAARAVGRGDEGSVRVGFVTGAAGFLLPGIVRRLRDERPRLQLELRHTAADEQPTALAQRRLDVGLTRLPGDVSTDRLVVHRVVPDRLVAAVPAGSWLAVQEGELQPRDLRHAALLFWPREMAPSLHDQVMRYVQPSGAPAPGTQLTSRDTVALLGLVAGHVGVTLVSESTARVLHRQGVAYRRLADAPRADLAVVHRQRPSPAVRAVLDACDEVIAAGEVAAPGDPPARPAPGGRAQPAQSELLTGPS